VTLVEEHCISRPKLDQPESGRFILPIEKGFSMKKNVGPVDKGIRIVFALILVAVILMNVLTGAPATIAIVIATFLLITSAVGVRPLYSVLRISTLKKRNEAH
jgi:hypothetical protein